MGTEDLQDNISVRRNDVVEATITQGTDERYELFYVQAPYSKDGKRVTVLRAQAEPNGVTHGLEFNVEQPRSKRISGVGLIPAKMEDDDEAPDKPKIITTLRVVGRKNEPAFKDVKWSPMARSFSRDGVIFRDRKKIRR